jgi:transcriptional regulator with XRE-family HTH domain
MEIRDTFRNRRLAFALTQEQAAQRARLTRKTVSDFENGRSSISLANLSRLLAAVGLELAVREASARPTLDELASRYPVDEALASTPRRARRK